MHVSRQEGVPQLDSKTLATAYVDTPRGLAPSECFREAQQLLPGSPILADHQQPRVLYEEEAAGAAATCLAVRVAHALHKR